MCIKLRPLQLIDTISAWGTHMQHAPLEFIFQTWRYFGRKIPPSTTVLVMVDMHWRKQTTCACACLMLRAQTLPDSAYLHSFQRVQHWQHPMCSSGNLLKQLEHPIWKNSLPSSQFLLDWC